MHAATPSVLRVTQVYQDLVKKHPSFRERSENVDLSVSGCRHGVCSAHHDLLHVVGALYAIVTAWTCVLHAPTST
jgi:hypothetical protein